ncbi:24938_t:CDS:2, partial [Gigaspora margarita]
ATNFCHYGYANVGLIHGDISKIQILRSPDEKQVVILHQKPKKAIKLQLQQRSNSLLTVEPCVQENSSQGSNIYQQLITAQKAIFEGELFDQIYYKIA